MAELKEEKKLDPEKEIAKLKADVAAIQKVSIDSDNNYKAEIKRLLDEREIERDRYKKRKEDLFEAIVLLEECHSALYSVVNKPLRSETYKSTHELAEAILKSLKKVR